MCKKILKPGTLVVIDKPLVDLYHAKVGVIVKYIKAFEYDSVTPLGVTVERRHYFSVSLGGRTHVFPHDEIKLL